MSAKIPIISKSANLKMAMSPAIVNMFDDIGAQLQQAGIQVAVVEAEAKSEPVHVAEAVAEAKDDDPMELLMKENQELKQKLSDVNTQLSLLMVEIEKLKKPQQKSIPVAVAPVAEAEGVWISDQMAFDRKTKNYGVYTGELFKGVYLPLNLPPNLTMKVGLKIHSHANTLQVIEMHHAVEMKACEKYLSTCSKFFIYVKKEMIAEKFQARPQRLFITLF